MCSGAPALSGFVMVLMKMNPIDIKGEKLCACVLYFQIYKVFFLLFFFSTPTVENHWVRADGGTCRFCSK